MTPAEQGIIFDYGLDCYLNVISIVFLTITGGEYLLSTNLWVETLRYMLYVGIATLGILTVIQLLP